MQQQDDPVLLDLRRRYFELLRELNSYTNLSLEQKQEFRSILATMANAIGLLELAQKTGNTHGN